MPFKNEGFLVQPNLKKYDYTKKRDLGSSCIKTEGRSEREGTIKSKFR